MNEVSTNKRKRNVFLIHFQWRFLWLLPILFLILQVVVAAALGFLWLYEHNFFVQWLIFGLVSSLLAWLIGCLWARSRSRLPELEVSEEEYWSNLEKKAFAQVESYTSSLNYEDYDFKKMDDVVGTASELLHRVALVYHPKKKRPEFDVSLALVLLLFERVVRDLRQKLADEVPGTYLFTVHDLMRMQTLYSIYRPIYNIYRVVSFPLNPFSAAVRESRAQLNKQAVGAFSLKMRQMFFRYLFKLVGYYAVELYSGRLRYEDLASGAKVAREPIRTLVVGREGSGKSCFIREAFGEENLKEEQQNADGKIFSLVHPEMGALIIHDCLGYDRAQPAGFFSFFQTEQTPFERHLEEIRTSDVLFLVSDVTKNDRKWDRQFINAFYHWCENQKETTPPVLIIIVTGLERLEVVRYADTQGNLENIDEIIEKALQEHCESIHLRQENFVVPFFPMPKGEKTNENEDASEIEDEGDEGKGETNELHENDAQHLLVTIFQELNDEIIRIQESRKISSHQAKRDFSKTARQLGSMSARIGIALWKKGKKMISSS
ncbi:MAG: hypothetical protein Q4D38_13380 [Planctomycetia bacterium]|nr:hypothetical protein [Planctomycetia bacterium]